MRIEIRKFIHICDGDLYHGSNISTPMRALEALSNNVRAEWVECPFLAKDRDGNEKKYPFGWYLFFNE